MAMQKNRWQVIGDYVMGFVKWMLFLPWSFQAKRGYVAIDVWAQVQEEKVLIISRESVGKSEDMVKVDTR